MVLARILQPVSTAHKVPHPLYKSAFGACVERHAETLPFVRLVLVLQAGSTDTNCLGKDVDVCCRVHARCARGTSAV